MIQAKRITCGNCNKQFAVSRNGNSGPWKGTHACDTSYEIDGDGIAKPISPEQRILGGMRVSVQETPRNDVPKVT